MKTASNVTNMSVTNKVQSGNKKTSKKLAKYSAAKYLTKSTIARPTSDILSHETDQLNDSVNSAMTSDSSNSNDNVQSGHYHHHHSHKMNHQVCDQHKKMSITSTAPTTTLHTTITNVTISYNENMTTDDDGLSQTCEDRKVYLSTSKGDTAVNNCFIITEEASSSSSATQPLIAPDTSINLCDDRVANNKDADFNDQCGDRNTTPPNCEKHRTVKTNGIPVNGDGGAGVAAPNDSLCNKSGVASVTEVPTDRDSRNASTCDQLVRQPPNSPNHHESSCLDNDGNQSASQNSSFQYESTAQVNTKTNNFAVINCSQMECHNDLNNPADACNRSNYSDTNASVNLINAKQTTSPTSSRKHSNTSAVQVDTNYNNNIHVCSTNVWKTGNEANDDNNIDFHTTIAKQHQPKTNNANSSSDKPTVNESDNCNAINLNGTDDNSPINNNRQQPKQVLSCKNNSVSCNISNSSLHLNQIPPTAPPVRIPKETMESKRERKAAKTLAIITGLLS